MIWKIVDGITLLLVIVILVSWGWMWWEGYVLL